MSNDHAPFRADQVGCLLRPAELMTARDKAAKGEITKAALTEVENRLIQRRGESPGGHRHPGDHRR